MAARGTIVVLSCLSEQKPLKVVYFSPKNNKYIRLAMVMEAEFVYLMMGRIALTFVARCEIGLTRYGELGHLHSSTLTFQLATVCCGSTFVCVFISRSVLI
jgi:hypothetical protein